MPIAELILESSQTDFESFYFKATDQSTSLKVLVASRDQFNRLLAEAAGAPGLYVLQAEDSTVYVGQSLDLQNRLKSHRTTNKIDYRKVMVLLRDQGLARYLDYGEARLYQWLKEMGFRLEQSDLSGSLPIKRSRLTALDREHVETADAHVKRFLEYSLALGLSKPAFLASSPRGTQSLTASALVAPSASASAKPVNESTSRPARKKLTVTTEIGEVFTGDVVAEVFVRVIQFAGLAQVAALGLKLSGKPLVSRVKSTKSFSRIWEIDGWFIETHSDTAEKAVVLRRIAYGLNKAWKVDLAA